MQTRLIPNFLDPTFVEPSPGCKLHVTKSVVKNGEMRSGSWTSGYFPSYFSGLGDLRILLLPCLILAACFYDVAFGVKLSSQQKLWADFVTAVLFFNSTHAILTLVLMAKIPELRSWVADRVSVGMINPVKLFVGFAILMTLYNFFWRVYQANWSATAYTTLITGLMYLFRNGWGMAHVILQCRGISILYNRHFAAHLPRGSTVAEKLKKQEQVERNFSALFWPVLILHRLFALLMEPSPLQNILIYGTGGCIGILFLYLLNSLRPMDGNIRPFKLVYYLRYVICALAPYSFVAIMGVHAVHGAEYMEVFKKILEKSALTPRARKRTWLWSVTSLGVFSLFALATTLYSLQNTSLLNLNFLLWGVAISTGVSQTHYLVDGILFRISRPEVKTALKPLLLGF